MKKQARKAVTEEKVRKPRGVPYVKDDTEYVLVIDHSKPRYIGINTTPECRGVIKLLNILPKLR